ncbi:hypothetical protein K1T71_014263 [Dendrolimus kikuchii]|uniref:Uncharacterized protein n=1 Tax=Dendrolimus kikuchii TaxID=765133 RepID=A0ACC1CFQ4_9NEOP|nr:hypothetical protein K1T71_014263 [Dendrolimus kikuchii]
MDFARKQLEKYGWSDGKGLGKHENGISEALKPKLKRSVAGIGHDPASEFNEHWWTALYDKAARNIEVKEKNNKTKKIKATNDFEITNSTWKLKNDKHKSNEKYSDNFVRTAVLTNGGSKIEDVREAVVCETEKKDVFQMTDEELFKACEGRTAHKGARHGLKALGKLARIAQQEEMLLAQPQYNGYSHSIKKSNSEIVENIMLDDEKEVKIKKKKKKSCSSGNNMYENSAIDDNVASEVKEIEVGTKSKKSKESIATVEIENSAKRKLKKRKIKEHIQESNEVQDIDKLKKKKKRKNIYNDTQVVGGLDTEIEESSCVRKKKKCK